MVNCSLLIPLKTSENHRFPGAFSKDQRGTLGGNGCSSNVFYFFLDTTFKIPNFYFTVTFTQILLYHTCSNWVANAISPQVISAPNRLHILRNGKFPTYNKTKIESLLLVFSNCNRYLHDTGLFVYPLDPSESKRFSDVFREYRKRPAVWNELVNCMQVCRNVKLNISFNNTVLPFLESENNVSYSFW